MAKLLYFGIVSIIPKSSHDIQFKKKISLKNYLKIILVIFIAIIITVIIFYWNQQNQPIDSTTDSTIESPKKKYSRKYNSTEPGLQSPVVDQEIKRINVEEDITNLKAGFARVKIKFTKEYKKDTDEDLAFTIVVYKEHQEIYRAEKLEN